MKKHTEDRLEKAIEYSLLKNGGYVKGSNPDFNKELALEPKRVIEFIKATQDNLWQSLEKIHGDNTEKVLLDSLCKELDTKGVLKVIRHGIK